MRRMMEIDPTIETRGDGVAMLTPHYFRHNYASILYNAGIDVLSAKKFLGHSNVKTTLEIYSHLSKEKRTLTQKPSEVCFKKVAGKLPEQKHKMSTIKQKALNT